MTDISIGGAKRARRGYSFDEVAIAPSRRTRDPQAVTTAWTIDAYRFDAPLLAAPMDSVVSPDSAIALAGLGMLAVLNLEGLWSRYEDPRPCWRRSPVWRRRSRPRGCRSSMLPVPSTPHWCPHTSGT